MAWAKLYLENQSTLFFAFPNDGWTTAAATQKSMIFAKQKLISSLLWAERASEQVAFRSSETHSGKEPLLLCFHPLGRWSWNRAQGVKLLTSRTHFSKRVEEQLPRHSNKADWSFSKRLQLWFVFVYLIVTEKTIGRCRQFQNVINIC